MNEKNQEIIDANKTQLDRHPLSNSSNDEGTDAIDLIFNDIASFLTGSHGLLKTYWVYGFLGGVVWAVTIRTLQPESGWDYHEGWIKFILVLFFIYYLAVYTAIWNAANKYTGNKVWSTLAKFAVIIGAIPMTVNLWKVFF